MHARPLAFASTLAVCLAACSDDEGFRLGALGMIDLRPTTAEFIIERVPLGESAEQTIAVHNIGTGDLRIDDVHIEVLDALGASPVVATLRAEPPLFVIADAASSQPVTLTYTRVDDRPRRLQLVVESSDPRSPRAVVPLDVRPGAANLGAIPGQAIFALGDAPATKTIRLINAGNAPLSLSRMRLEAPESFSVALAGNAFPPNVNDLVLDPPVVIAPGTEQSLVVDFDPGDDLPASGRVVLYGNSVNSREGFPVPLIGNQSGPCILVRPNVIAFGTKALDSVSDISADIENCGVVPLDITGIALSTADDDSGASSERFSLVDATPSATSPWRLEPGAVRSTTVRYTAWTTGHSTLGPLPEVDRGTLLVHSNSRLPTRAVDITATTDVPERPTDIDGCEWDGGEVVKHQIELQMTADDAYEVWVDGDSIARDTGVWHSVDTYTFELDSGCHVLGIHAWDVSAVRSGLIALIKVDGVVRWTSGDAKPEWSVSGPDNPPGNWQDLFFDDSAWPDPRACSSTSVWGTAVAGLEQQGARWVWWNADCNDLSNAWFRLTFTVD